MVLSAEYSFKSINPVGVGSEFPLTLQISSENNINAVEGKLTFPSDLLDVKEIILGKSSINFWVEEPNLESPNTIFFSGITPGGFKSDSNIFTIIFKAKNAGVGGIDLLGAKVLLNDGEGTEEKTTVKKIVIEVRNDITPTVAEGIVDNELPESFRPEVGRSLSLFEGKWFVAFSTQDKNSGIKSYYVKESRQRVFSFLDSYLEAESPYILSNQDLSSYIYIKAVDNAGNERVEKISPRYPLPWYQNSSYWITILLIFLVLWLIKKWQKKQIKQE